MFYEREDCDRVETAISMNIDLLGRQVCLLLISQDAKGGDDWAVFSTTLQKEGGRFILTHKTGRLELTDDWVSRIKATTPHTRSILLGADFYLPLAVSSIGDERAEALKQTGFHWPTTSAER